jgi:hypothetical protein
VPQPWFLVILCAAAPAVLWSLWLRQRKPRPGPADRCEVCHRTGQQLQAEGLHLRKFPNPDCVHWLCEEEYSAHVRSYYSTCPNCGRAAVEA